jgi:hypothetical protein
MYARFYSLYKMLSICYARPCFMPKKTKKEKILADLRRSSHIVKPLASSVAQIQAVPSVQKFVFEKKPVITIQTKQTTHDYSYVYHDLIKITIFTIAVLTLQGMLYFVLQR